MDRGRLLIRSLLGLALFANVVSMAQAVAIDRPIFCDGAGWLFRLLQNGATSFGTNELRYAGALLEFPAWVLVSLDRGRTLLEPAIRTWEIGMTAHALLGLLLSFVLLRRHRLTGLFVFPLMSFALASQQCGVFPANLISLSLSAFWPLLILVTCAPLKGKGELALAGFLALILSTANEAALILLSVLAAAAWLRSRKGGAPRRRFERVAGVLAACMLSTFLRALLGPYPTSGRMFLGAYNVLPGEYFRVLIPVLLICAGLALGKPRFRKAAAPLLVACAIILAFCLGYYVPGSSIGVFHAGRLLGAVTGALLAVAFLVFLARRGKRGAEPAWLPAVLEAVCALMLVLSAAHDLKLNEDWEIGAGNLGNLASEASETCVVVDSWTWREKLFPFGMMNNYLTMTHMILSRNRRLDRVIVEGIPGTAPCELLSRKGAIRYFKTNLKLSGNYFRLRPGFLLDPKGPDRK